MITLLLASLYASILLSFLYRFALYPVFRSPLAKLPNAHPTSAILPTWLWYQAWIKNESRSVVKAHQEHGPVVRLGPNEVSVASLEGLRKVYSGRRFKRTPFFLSFANYEGTRNLVTMFDTNEHARRKKTMLQVYASTSVKRSRDFQKLSAVVLFQRLLPSLQEAASAGEIIDVYTLNCAIGAEFATAFFFGLGNGLNILAPGRENAREEFVMQGRTKMQELKGHKEAAKWLENHCIAMCIEAEASMKTETQISHSNSTFPAVYAHLAKAVLSEYPNLSAAQRLRLVASELLDNLEASREGDGIILTYAMHELSQQIELQRKLRSELIDICSFSFQPESEAELSYDSLQLIDALPFLDAVVRETLRVYSVSPGPQRRVVPSGGVDLGEYHIPAGTTISTSMRALHMNEEVFPQATKWKPERWLISRGKSENSDKDQYKWWWGFGSGAMSCSGKDFAVLVMKLTLALVYTHFETEIVDDSGIEQKDDLMATPIGNKLLLRLTPVTNIL